DHVEHGGLAGAVGAEQTDRLAATDVETHPAHDPATREVFFDAMHRKIVAWLLAIFGAARCGSGLPGGGSRWRNLRIGLPHARLAVPRSSHPSLPGLRGRIRERAARKVGLGPRVCWGFRPHTEAFDETEQIDHKRLGDNG